MEFFTHPGESLQGLHPSKANALKLRGQLRHNCIERVGQPLCCQGGVQVVQPVLKSSTTAQNKSLIVCKC